MTSLSRDHMLPHFTCIYPTLLLSITISITSLSLLSLSLSVTVCGAIKAIKVNQVSIDGLFMRMK